MRIHTNTEYGSMIIKDLNATVDLADGEYRTDEEARKFEFIEVYKDYICFSVDDWSNGEFHANINVTFDKPKKLGNYLKVEIITSSGHLEIVDERETYFKIPVNEQTILYIFQDRDFNVVEIFIER